MAKAPTVAAAVLFAALLPLSSSTASATGTYCAVTERTSDGFVSVREGPGVQYRSLGRLSPSDLLWIGTEKCRSDVGPSLCDEAETWVFAERVVTLQGVHSGLKGWVRASLVRQVTCGDENSR